MAACLSYVWMDVLNIPDRWDGYLNHKPFSCPTCMAGWFALLLIVVWDCPLLGIMFETAGWMAVAMVGSIILNFGIKRYL